MILAPSRVRSALSDHASAVDRRRPRHQRRAAVAIVLAGDDRQPHMCFIERVERAGDRWSGDVAFPGGWANDDDASLRDTAIRETREEVGLDLVAAEHLGDLPVRPIGTSLGEIGVSVFYIGEQRQPLVPDPHELADAFWVPGAHLLSDTNDTTVPWSGSALPGIEFDSRVIWGLTYRMLMDFLNLLRRS